MFISLTGRSNVRPSCFFRVPKGNKHAQGCPCMESQGMASVHSGELAEQILGTSLRQ